MQFHLLFFVVFSFFRRIRRRNICGSFSRGDCMEICCWRCIEHYILHVGRFGAGSWVMSDDLTILVRFIACHKRVRNCSDLFHQNLRIFYKVTEHSNHPTLLQPKKFLLQNSCLYRLRNLVQISIPNKFSTRSIVVVSENILPLRKKQNISCTYSNDHQEFGFHLERDFFR